MSCLASPTKTFSQCLLETLTPPPDLQLPSFRVEHWLLRTGPKAVDPDVWDRWPACVELHMDATCCTWPEWFLDLVWDGWQRTLALGPASWAFKSWSNCLKVDGSFRNFLLSRRGKEGGQDFISWDFPGGPVVKTASNAEGVGSIPGWQTKIPHAMQHGQKMFKKESLAVQWLGLLSFYCREHWFHPLLRNWDSKSLVARSKKKTIPW